jgi:hypothetical protein
MPVARRSGCQCKAGPGTTHDDWLRVPCRRIAAASGFGGVGSPVRPESRSLLVTACRAAAGRIISDAACVLPAGPDRLRSSTRRERANADGCLRVKRLCARSSVPVRSACVRSLLVPARRRARGPIHAARLVAPAQEALAGRLYWPFARSLACRLGYKFLSLSAGGMAP